MYCTNCGTPNPDNAKVCSGCAMPLANPYEAPQAASGYSDYPPSNIQTYLAQSILVTLFCCLPFGVVAIVYAAQASGKLSAGDYYGALGRGEQCEEMVPDWVLSGNHSHCIGHPRVNHERASRIPVSFD